MKKSTGKKRVGRPPTGRTPIIALTLPKQILEDIDKIAHQENATRAAIIRQMIVEGIAQRQKKRR